MADLARLERALRNADAAGDTDAARQLAAAIREQRAAQPAVDDSPADGMSTFDRFRAGIGRGMTSGARAITGALGATPLGTLNRALHSAVHCTVNIVMVRFYLYLLSTLAVWFMLIRAAFAPLGAA